jgi:hypothetical protein
MVFITETDMVNPLEPSLVPRLMIAWIIAITFTADNFSRFDPVEWLIFLIGIPTCFGLLCRKLGNRRISPSVKYSIRGFA